MSFECEDEQLFEDGFFDSKCSYLKKCGLWFEWNRSHTINIYRYPDRIISIKLDIATDDEFYKKVKSWK